MPDFQTSLPKSHEEHRRSLIVSWTAVWIIRWNLYCPFIILIMPILPHGIFNSFIVIFAAACQIPPVGMNLTDLLLGSKFSFSEGSVLMRHSQLLVPVTCNVLPHIMPDLLSQWIAPDILDYPRHLYSDGCVCFGLKMNVTTLKILLICFSASTGSYLLLIRLRRRNQDHCHYCPQSLVKGICFHGSSTVPAYRRMVSQYVCWAREQVQFWDESYSVAESTI